MQNQHNHIQELQITTSDLPLSGRRPVNHYELQNEKTRNLVEDILRYSPELAEKLIRQAS